MESLKVMKTVTSENRPSYNEWCQELKVSSQYNEPNRREPILRQSVKDPIGTTVWERIGKRLGL